MIASGTIALVYFWRRGHGGGPPGEDEDGSGSSPANDGPPSDRPGPSEDQAGPSTEKKEPSDASLLDMMSLDMTSVSVSKSN